MNNNLRLFITLNIMMLSTAIPLHAVVTFDAAVDKGPYNETTGMYDITKYGVTISVPSLVFESEHYDYEWSWYPSFDCYTLEPNTFINIESRFDNIKMISVKYFESEQSDYFGIYSHNISNPTNGKLQNYHFYPCNHSSYSVWTGNSLNISFSVTGETMISEITVYTSNDELPQKVPYIVTYDNMDGRDMVTYYYGYPKINQYHGHYASDDCYFINTLREAGTIILDSDEEFTSRIDYKRIKIDESFVDYELTSAKKWFSDYESVISIEGLDNFDTSKVTNMSGMFSGCCNLKELDLSNFDTSNVTDMSYMFSECNTLCSLDLSNFNTSKVTNMCCMFDDCLNLKELDLNNFDTSNVKDMSGMFSYNHFTNLEIGNFDTSKVIDMSYMFWGCDIEKVDLSHFVTSNVINMESMFADCSLASLDLSNFDFSKVTDSGCMFTGSAIKLLYIPSSMAHVSQETCAGLGSYDYPCVVIAPERFDFDVDTSGKSFIWKGGCFRFAGAPLPYSVYENETLTFYYDKLKDVRTGTIYCPIGRMDWAENKTNVKKVVFDASFSDTYPSSTGSWFYGMTNLSEIIGIEHLNTSKTLYMDYMFAKCSSLARLDLSHFDTSSLQGSSKMLSDCVGLEELYISSTMGNLAENSCEGVGRVEPCEIIAPAGFDFNVDSSNGYFFWKNGFFKWEGKELAILSNDKMTLTFHRGAWNVNDGETTYSIDNDSNNPAWYAERVNVTKVVFDPSFADARPTSCFGWFRGMSNLENIEGIEYLNTEEVKTMSYMFNSCEKLKTVDVTHFNTEKVEKMGYMFMNCTGLESIDISGFDYSANTSCYRMFYNCTNLRDVKLGEWKNNTNDQYGYMFSGCSSLETLDLSQLNLPSDAKTTSMLYGCKSLSLLNISSSMSILNSSACSGVGTAANPCVIDAPASFDFGVDTSGDYFKWKSGYFKLHSLFANGDVNHDGVVNISDVMMMVNHVIGRTPAGFYVESADQNGDNTVNISDIMYVVNIVIGTIQANAPMNAREAMTDGLSLMRTNSGYVLCLNNVDAYTALQTDVWLPEDCHLGNVRLNTDRTDGHRVTYTDLGDGHYRVAVYSLDARELRGHEGALLFLDISGKTMDNPTVTDAQLTNRLFETVTLAGVSELTGITVPVDNENDNPTFTVDGVKARKGHRGVVVRKGRKTVSN